jgi:hypothetical protein
MANEDDKKFLEANGFGEYVTKFAELELKLETLLKCTTSSSELDYISNKLQMKPGKLLELTIAIKEAKGISPQSQQGPTGPQTQQVFDPKFLERFTLANDATLFWKHFNSQGFKFEKDFIWNDFSTTEIEVLLNSNLNSFFKKSAKNQDWSLISIIGASGIGKTRLSFEIAKSLKDRCHFIDVFVKMSNGEIFKKMNTTVERYLASFLLSRLFEISPDHAIDRLPTFIRQYLNDVKWDIASILDLLSVYRQKKGMKENETLYITLRVDEVQFLIPNVLPKTDYERRSSAIYEFSKTVMDLAFAGHKINTFILPIFSGTLPLTHLNLFAKTHYVIKPIFLTPLPIDKSKQLIRDNLPGIFSPVLQGNILENLLYSYGPIPRSLEYIIATIREHPDWNLEQVYTSLLNMNLSTDPEASNLPIPMLLEILYYVFSGVMVLNLDEVLYRFLWNGTMSIIDHRLFLPMIYAQQFIGKSISQFLFLRDFLKFPSFPDASGIEKFPLSFFAFKQYLFLSQGINNCLLSAFFSGAVNKFTDSQWIFLGNDPMQYYESDHQSIHSLTSVAMKGHPPIQVDCLQKPCSVWVGKSWQQGDGFLTFPPGSVTMFPSQFNNLPAQSVPIPGIVVFTESKMLKDTKNQIAVIGHSANAIKHEREKAFKGPLKLNYFLFCTNARASEKKIIKFVEECPDTVVIFYDVWEKVFSHLFWMYKAYGDLESLDEMKE